MDMHAAHSKYNSFITKFLSLFANITVYRPLAHVSSTSKFEPKSECLNPDHVAHVDPVFVIGADSCGTI